MSATADIGDTIAYVARLAAARQEATPTQLDAMQRLLVPQLIATRANHNITAANTVSPRSWAPTGNLAATSTSPAKAQ